MDNLKIEQSKSTPLVDFDFANNQMFLKGKSYPENTFEFYKPVLAWLEEYFSQKRPNVEFSFEIVYYNSSSSKILFDIFSMLENHSSKGQKIKVYWYFNKTDETIQEAGQDFIEDFPSLDIELKTL